MKTRRRTGRTWMMIAMAVVIALVLVFWRAAGVEAVYPVERVGAWWSRQVWPRLTGVFCGSAAMAENVRLRRECASLQLLRADYEHLRQENGRLRAALAYGAREPGRWLAAEVFAENGGAAAARRTLRVGRGALDGVEKGAVVVVPEGLVGLVTELSPHTATVTRLDDASLRVSCETDSIGAVRTRGILCGGSPELLSLRYLTGAKPATTPLKVLTSGLGGVFPRGLVVGTLLGVRLDESGLMREGEVQPAVDLASLEDVFIRCEK